MLLYSTDRKTLQCYDSLCKEFSQQHSDDALQVMSFPWHATEWLEKTWCLIGMKNNPCGKRQTLLCVNSGSKMTATVILNRELRRHLGSVQETSMGKTLFFSWKNSWFHGRHSLNKKKKKKKCNCPKLFLVFQLDTMYFIPTFIPSLKLCYIFGVSIFWNAVLFWSQVPLQKKGELVSLLARSLSESRNAERVSCSGAAMSIHCS